MAHLVQRGTIYPTASQIPNDVREKVKEGQWWNGNRLFIYEIIVSPESPPNYYVVSFSLFERFLHALFKIARKDCLGNKVRDLTQATTIRFIDQTELRRLLTLSTSSAPPQAISAAAPQHPSPSPVVANGNQVKTPPSVEGPKNDPAPSTQPPSLQERVVKYIPFDQCFLTEIDQQAFNIIYQRLIDPKNKLVFQSCSIEEKPDFIFVQIFSRATEYFDNIRLGRVKGTLPAQAFYLISSTFPIGREELPFEPECFSICLIEKPHRYGRFNSQHPVIDWDNSSKEVQHQAALFLLRIFNFSIQSIQSLPIIPNEKQKLTYAVIGPGKGFSKMDKENINRLSQRVLGQALKVEKSDDLVHFAVANVKDERKEAKDKLYLTLPYYLVTTTVQVNVSHFDYDAQWTQKVSLCKPGSGDNIVNWEDPESVRQVAMLFLRIYQLSLVSFSSQKAVA